MARITLVRHGEAAAGWGDDADPGLSAVGHAQALAVAALLASDGRRRLVSSPLLRTRETAAPLAERWGTEPLIDPRVGEIPSPTPLAERGAWLRSVLAGRWSQQDGAVLAWRDAVVAGLLDIAGDAVVFTHFVAVNAALAEATDDDRVVCASVGHCARTVFDTSDGRLRLVTRPDEEAPGRVL